MSRRFPMLMLAIVLLTLSASCASPDRRQDATTAKEPAYRSKHPLYFRFAFGSRPGQTMLCVLDESEGDGTGYNVAYIDEGMKNGLTSAVPRKFRLVLDPKRLTPWYPKFSFIGPLGATGKAEYTLDLYSLEDAKDPTIAGKDYNFKWSLKAADWNYVFMDKKVRFHESAADALKAEPTLLGGKWAWKIWGGSQNGNVSLIANLSDDSGDRLTDLVAANKGISPVLTLFKEKEKAFEQKMQFG